MEEQIYAFLAGGLLSCVITLAILLLMGSHDVDPDTW